MLFTLLHELRIHQFLELVQHPSFFVFWHIAEIGLIDQLVTEGENDLATCRKVNGEFRVGRLLEESGELVEGAVHDRLVLFDKRYEIGLVVKPHGEGLCVELDEILLSFVLVSS